MDWSKDTASGRNQSLWGISMKTNIYNKKTVQKEEWIKSDTVVITYHDGSKEIMSRKSFERIIKG